MERTEKKQVYIFGCGNFFHEKQEYILKHYEIVGAFDNYKTGTLQLGNGKEVTISIPAFKEKISVIITMDNFAGAWVQLKCLGFGPGNVLFPCGMQPLVGLERKLFECGGSLKVIDGNLYYMDQWGGRHLVNDHGDMEELAYLQEKKKINSDFICRQAPVEPLNRTFGFSRGMPVDRYYIEKFLEGQKERIAGDVLEIAEDIYTKQFGGIRIRNSFMLHVSSDEDGYIKGDFETGEGIAPDSMDCIILTQTLPFIFDCGSAVSNVYSMLRRGGSALITVGGITQISRYDMERWGQYWSFTDLSLRRLFEKAAPGAEYMVSTYGNAKSAAALLYGISAEELTQSELDYVDGDYQVSICAVLTKPE